MSDTVSNSPSTTRRTLIGGRTLGAAAVVVEAVRPSPVLAVNGDPVLAGQVNSATAAVETRDMVG